MGQSRRNFLQVVLGSAVFTALPFSIQRVDASTSIDVGDARLKILSDGHLSLPTDFLKPPNMPSDEFNAFLADQGIAEGSYQPACNLTVWQSADRVVLFDVGAGDSFMETTGELAASLEAANIDPELITDVVITHAHPDHLWGLVDDFDELVFPNASYHIHESEWDFWWDDKTVSIMPESRKVFAVGAKNRFEYIQDQINVFRDGDEILPGVEAILTAGHTPGHSSFVLHSGGQSVMVVGDALTHPVLSFQPKKWLSESDQDPELARTTRIRLLDRLAHEKMLLVGYHLPSSGVGFAERDGEGYRFVSDY